MAYPNYPGSYPPPPYSQPGYPGGPPGSGYPGGPAGSGYPGGVSSSYPSYPGGPVGQRQYYMLRSRLNGLVLDVEGASPAPGAHVVLANQKTGPARKDTQWWFDDPATGTIRNRLNEYVFDIGPDGCIVLSPFSPGNVNQQWERSELFVRNRVSSRVFDIAGNNSSPGARVIAYDRHGSNNQLFDVQFEPHVVEQAIGFMMPPGSTPATAPSYPVKVAAKVPPVASARPPARQLFFIVSEMSCKVLDIEGDNPTSGAKVIMWNKKGGRPKNQLWYFDQQGVIHSALNDFVLEAQVDGAPACMMPPTGSPHQRWTLSGNKIMKNQYECLDIAGENRKEGAKVISYKYKGSPNQHWRLEYV